MLADAGRAFLPVQLIDGDHLDLAHINNSLSEQVIELEDNHGMQEGVALKINVDAPQEVLINT